MDAEHLGGRGMWRSPGIRGRSIGQCRVPHVHRFVVKHSVEETVGLIRDGGEAEVAESRVRKAAAGNELMGLRVRDVLRLVEAAT